MNGITLETYFAECLQRGVIDHALRASLNANGHVEFYIHPANTDGRTLDFVVSGNSLFEKFNTAGQASQAAMVLVNDHRCESCGHEWVAPKRGNCPKCHSEKTVSEAEGRRIDYRRV